MRKKWFVQSVAIAAMLTFAASEDVGAITEETAVYMSQAVYIGEFHRYDELMAAVMEEMRRFNTEVTFTFTGSLDNFNASFDSTLQQALVQPGNDYIHGTLLTWRYTYSSAGEVTLKLTYVGTLEQEQFVTKRVKEIAAELTSEPNMSDFDKVKAVNDYIVRNVAYSYDTKETPHHIYTFLTEQRAVCQAYALLAYRLFEEMGIESRYVVGYAGELHAWNTVKVDGVWYQLDTTWNDIIYNGDDLGDNLYYNYFLVTNEQLRQDHSWDEALYPVATDTRYAAYHDMEMALEHDGNTYYRSARDGFLYKRDEAGVVDVVATVRAAYLAAHDDTIYFANESNNGFLTAYNVTTKTLTTIDEVAATNVRMQDGALRYEVNGAVKTYVLPERQHRQFTDFSATEQEAEVVAEQIEALSNVSAADVIAVKEAYEQLSLRERRDVENVQKLMVMEKKLRRAIEAEQRIRAIDTQSATVKRQLVRARLAVSRVPMSQRKAIDSLRVLELLEKRLK